MTEKYAYCSTVPKTFVQDCSLDHMKKSNSKDNDNYNYDTKTDN